MKSLYSLLWFTGLPFLTVAQESYHTLTGQITDAQTGQVLPYAHLRLKNRLMGAVANEFGEYQFVFLPGSQPDTLIISSLGYQSRTLPCPTGLEFLPIQLEQMTVNLPEVLIRKVDAHRIVKQALNRLADGYPTAPFQLSGLYREYLKAGNRYINLLEAALIVNDHGRTKKPPMQDIFVQQVRLNEKHDDEYREFQRNKRGDNIGMKNRYDNQFLFLCENDPIRNSGEPGSVLLEATDRYSFVLDSMSSIGGTLVYCMTGQGKGEKERMLAMQMRLIVRQNDSLLLEVTHSATFPKADQRVKLFEWRVRYHDTDNGVYLEFLSFYNTLITRRKGREVAYREYREFFVNAIRMSLTPLPASAIRMRTNQPMHRQPVALNPDFWKTYTVLPTQDGQNP